MNTYTTEFFAKCPNNGVRIKYTLCIETTRTLSVEDVVTAVETFKEGYHELIADKLIARFGGQQTMTADHHSVTIKTVRTTK